MTQNTALADDRVHYAALVISAVIIGIYVLEHVFTGAVGQFMFVASAFLEEPWTIITSIFLHNPDDYMHLLNNLFFLVVFGFMLENIIGTKRFLTMYIAAGIFANLSAFTFYPTTPVLGASGAISGIVAALAVIRPRTIGLFWGVPMPMWVVLIGWIGINAIGFGSDASIAFEAHLYGLFFGALYGMFIREKHSLHRHDDDEDPDIDIKEWEREYM